MKRCLGCMEEYDDSLEICPHCGYVEGTMPDEAIHMIPGTILHNRYIIGKTVGFGGFGVTYIAWDTVLELRVAIKEYLPSEFSTRMPGRPQLTIFNGNKAEQFNEGMKKFLDEARRLAKFQNEEGIVKIYDCFEENATAYIIMEYLEGVTLAEYINEVGTVPVDVAIAMVTPIMHSLKAVHSEGIIHRDIAPDNIMISADNKIKLIDFGAARYATTSHSRSLTVIIKPGYSPEEQYRSRGDQGPHTDVYAVGAVIYKLITGKTPPDAMERRAHFESERKDILNIPSKLGVNISTDKENAILNAMNVRIEDRTPDMDTMIKELTGNEPVARRNGKIKKIDVLKWPFGVKIAVPTALAAIVTLLVLFFTGVIGFNKISPREIYIPEGMTRIPRIVSMEEETARAELEKRQINLVVSGVQYDEQIDAGCILYQSMSVGSVVPVNYSMNVIMSVGTEQVEVPYVIDLPKERAIEELEAERFTYEIVEEYDSVVEEGCIISQSVKGGNEIDLGSIIVLTVSLGRDPEITYEFSGDTMPDLVGMDFDDAKKICEAYGIRLVASEYVYSDTASAMSILSQTIAKDADIQNDIVVEITISKGQVIRKVPLLVYREEAKAIEMLENRTIQYEIEYAASETVAQGCVISQSVEAGTIVAENEKVALVVSTGAPQFEMINVVGQQSSVATEQLQGLGLIVTINYSYDANTPEGEVLEQNITEGTLVRKGDEVTITACSKSELIEVPAVSGQKYESAEEQLKNAGFKVEKNEIYNAKIEKGIVISQTPVAGSMQLEKTKILLTVSLGKEPYTVRFDPVGGAVSLSEKTVYDTETFGELPTPTKANHKFLGWYTAQNAGTKVTESMVVAMNGDITLYARWERVLVQVSFDANGGTTGTTSSYLGVGEKYVLPTASRRYFNFDGWYTEKTGGTKVTSSTDVSNSAKHTLYAHWTAKTVVVTYDAADGTASNNSKTYELGHNYENVTATRTGYTFMGWFTKANGQGERITVDTIVTSESTHTLYAYWSNSAYTVSLDSNGGNSISNIQVEYASEYGTLPTPLKTGYVFDGWYTERTAGTQITAASKVNVAANHTLYAHWSNATYTMRFNSNGGSCSTSSKSVIYDMLCGTLPMPTRTGYVFDGWYTDSNVLINEQTKVAITEDITVYAHWTKGIYAANFDANGGNCETTSIAITYDNAFGTLPTPTRTGYRFDGWYTSNVGGSLITSETTVGYAGNYTLYAHWTALTFTVTFNANGGSVTTASKDVVYDGTYGMLPTPARGGYTFDGWFTETSGGSQVIADNIYNTAADITLYAQWGTNSYTVSFDANGGNVSQGSKNVVYAANYGTLPTPTRNGYTFDGWYTAASGGTRVVAETKVEIINNITLYAHWSNASYTVTFNANGGNASEPSKSVKYNSNYGDLATATRTGYTFEGWYTETSGGNKVTASTQVTKADNHTLYAHWKANSYTVTLNANGGTVSKASISVTYDGTYSGLVNPVERAGYDFDGWYTAASGGTKVNPGDKVTITSNQTLYAHWKAYVWGYDLSNSYITCGDAHYVSYKNGVINCNIIIKFRTKATIEDGILFESTNGPNNAVLALFIKDKKIHVLSEDSEYPQPYDSPIEYTLKPNTEYEIQINPSLDWMSIERRGTYRLNENGVNVKNGDITINMFKNPNGYTVFGSYSAHYNHTSEYIVLRATNVFILAFWSPGFTGENNSYDGEANFEMSGPTIHNIGIVNCQFAPGTKAEKIYIN